MSSEPVPGTLLIVDDEPGGREALEGLLLNQGYRLEFASSGQEALRLIPQLLPDLVLLDVMMPGMDGFQVCRKLRVEPGTAEIPVLLVTALDDRDTRLEGISAGADDFISKPYDRAELRLRVKTIMRIGRYRRLLTERARFNSVVEHAPNGYVTVKDDCRITYANASARRFLGLGDDPGTWGEFFHAAKNQYRLEPDRAWPDEELRLPDRHYLIRPETPTAGAFWLSVTLLDQAESSYGERLLRLRDITDEVDLQRDRHSFHRMVGHKLRTPLNGIVAILELMEEEFAGTEHARMIALAVGSANRLHQGVEDILTFADLSSQRGGEESFPIADLPDLVRRLQAEMDIRTLDLAVAPALLAERVALSSLHVETICREILENARKFHPQQNPRLGCTAEAGARGRLLLAIQDDGVHLSPHQLSQVWIPYYQGEKRVTGEVVGMGLGLSVVKSIIVSKGGRISMRNRPNAPGIQIDMDLPLAAAK